jgi:glycosyltransferase involved in cell wall biosynthesis
VTLDILHVIHQFPPESRGGSEGYAHGIAKLQLARGQRVEVLAGTKHWREHLAWSHDEVDGIPVHRLHRDDLYFDHHAKMWHPGVEAAFAAFLAERRPAIVHVHHWVRLTCNLVEICKHHGIPAVVTLHDYYTSCPRAFRRRTGDEACRRPLSTASCGDCVPRYGYESAAEISAGIELYADHYRAELAQAARVLVAVGSTADLLAQTTGTPRDRYTVLPLGYEPRFRAFGPLPRPAANAPLRFAYWGSIGRHKGVDVLLRAMRLVQGARPGRAELHVLGDFESPAFEAELREAAAGLPVTFHGPFDAAKLHATAPTVGVFPSTCIETWGLVLDECFELGLPCITSDLGALPERAVGGGLRTRAGDAADLAAAMQRCIDEPALLATLRQHLPAASPSLVAHVDALLQIYAMARTELPATRFAAPVGPDRRVQFLQMQRESALAKAVPPGGPR